MIVIRPLLLCLVAFSWTSATYYSPGYRLRYPYVTSKQDRNGFNNRKHNPTETANQADAGKGVSPPKLQKETSEPLISRIGETLSVPFNPIVAGGFGRYEPQQPPRPPPPGGAFGSYGQLHLPGLLSLQFGGQGGLLGSLLSPGGSQSHLVSAASVETPLFGGSHYLASGGNGPILFPGEGNEGGFGLVGGLFGGLRPINSVRDDHPVGLNEPQLLQYGNKVNEFKHPEILQHDIRYQKLQATSNPDHPKVYPDPTIVITPHPFVRRPPSHPQEGPQTNTHISLPYSPLNQIPFFYPAHPYGSQGYSQLGTYQNHGPATIHKPYESTGTHGTEIYHESDNHGVYFQIGGIAPSASGYGHQTNDAHYGTSSFGIAGPHGDGGYGEHGGAENYPGGGYYGIGNIHGPNYGPKPSEGYGFGVHHEVYGVVDQHPGVQHGSGNIYGGQHPPANYGEQHTPVHNGQHTPVNYGEQHTPGHNGQHTPVNYGEQHTPGHNGQHTPVNYGEQHTPVYNGQHTPVNYGEQHTPGHNGQHTPVNYGEQHTPVHNGQHTPVNYGGNHGTSGHGGHKESEDSDVKKPEEPSATSGSEPSVGESSSSVSAAEETGEIDQPTKVVLMPTKFLDKPVAVPDEVEARFADLELNRVVRGLQTRRDQHEAGKERSSDIKRAQNLKCSDCLLTMEVANPIHHKHHSAKQHSAKDLTMHGENIVETQ